MSSTVNNLEASAQTSPVTVQEAASDKCKTLHTILGPADSRPHILFVIDALCVMGGTERVLLNIIRRLPKDLFRCSLLTFRIDQSAVPTAAIDCPLYVLPLKKTYDWNALRVAVKVRRLIRKERVAIVHTFFETSDLWAGPIAKLSGCPLLISSRRDLGTSRGLKHRLGYRLLRDVYDLVLAVSPQVRDFCIEHDRVRPVKARTLFNGVDLEAAAAARNGSAARLELGIPDDGPVITTVANVRRIKGIDLLVEAARPVCRKYPKALFLVVGKDLEPEYFLELHKRIFSAGLTGRFRFLGACADVFPILGLSSIFCLPSRSEGFSNALLEAMAAGLPCVATDVGGNREILKNREAGFIVPKENWRALARRLIFLLDNPAMAGEIGKRAEGIVRAKFTVEAMMKNLVGVYQGLLSARDSAWMGPN